MNKTSGEWLSILDYAMLKKVSISTVRRHIKAGRLKSKFEDGRYFIFVSDFNKKWVEGQAESKEIFALKLEIGRLEKIIKQKEIENCELKMLVEVYEQNQKSHPPQLPELPRI